LTGGLRHISVLRHPAQSGNKIAPFACFIDTVLPCFFPKPEASLSSTFYCELYPLCGKYSAVSFIYPEITAVW